MGLDAALGIAGSGLDAINLQLALISQNLANAATPQFATETSAELSVEAGPYPAGVVSAPAIRAGDPYLEQQSYQAGADAAGASTTSAALATLEPLLGTVGSGTDLNSLLGKLSDAFSTLLANPASAPQQGAVVTAAQSLAQSVNALSTGYQSARQQAQDSLVSEVGQANADLTQIGSLSKQIVALQASGQSTADLQNSRAQAMASLSQLMDVRFAAQPNGDMQVWTSGGAFLPTSGGPALSIGNANAGPGAYYPGGGLPGIMLGGSDVTAQIAGGSIGANLTLRDRTLPLYQGELDEFSQNLATRFSAQGLALFTDPAGGVPPGNAGPPAQAGYVGFAGIMTVNPAVAANPALVRDGTLTGPAALNPQQLAGFTGLISAVLSNSFGANQASGAPWPPSVTTGLGPSGTLTAPYGAQTTLSGTIVALSAAQAADAAGASTAVSETQGFASALQTRLSQETGVNTDAEMATMVQLQNAYSANAKVITAVQAMFGDLLAAVQ